MPLFNYGRVPGYAPGGRAINPETGRIAGLPGGMDYLAGFGPAPAGVTDTPEWTNVVPKRLASAPGISNPLDAFAFGIQRFGRAPQQSAINAFNTKYGTQYTAPQLFDYSQKFAGTPGTDLGAGLNKNVINAQNAAPFVPGANFGSIFNGGGNTFGVGGIPGTTAPTGPTLGGATALLNTAMNTNYNDQNDPGGFIRKYLNQFKPETPLTRTYSGA